MKKYLGYGIVAFFFIYVLFEFYTAHGNINSQFIGIVQKVSKKPFSSSQIITVNDKDYDLEYIRWYDDAAIVAVGDSVVKEKGTQMMSLFKKGNK
ncbi:hypothetical protein LX99_01061 [Mucilaginibacter oryzae]|uniref:Uncharacterized protein n=1 Tax=Mucilaginibacter oryzae TaxID=468058 RepID=A0A316HZT8_9SPHI|nr:hypothetical protein [Mucilaginibacter oryzae]PWK80592.1 hypothetical protein LX99_01061 [Mucilaginibacter oryzae]